jgi:hypothetical protein
MLPVHLLYGVVIIVISIIIYFLTLKYGCKCDSNRKEFAVINPVNLTQDQGKLLSKLEFLEKKIIRLVDKLNSLQITANISKEQLDFAVATLNGRAANTA